MEAQSAGRGISGGQLLRRVGVAALLAVPLALLASAAAGIIVAVLALPIALLVTHDGYLALLALSYGPFAAALTLQAVLAATLVWSIINALREPQPHYHLASLLMGAIAGGVGLFGGALPLFAALDVPWRYGPALPFAGVPALIAAALGMAAAGLHAAIAARRPISAAKLTGWRNDMQQMAWQILWFAMPLALLFTGWAALLAALGRI
jgi:hypothetical protein